MKRYYENMQPLIPVVILSMNKTKDILDCILSVKKLSYQNTAIIVIDNGSTDGTPDTIKAKYPDVHLIRNPVNKGICEGRNQGLQYAQEHFSSKYILFLDNDTVLDREYLTALYNNLEMDESAGMAFGKAYQQYPSRTLMSVGISVNFWAGTIKDRGSGEDDRGQYDKKEYIDAAPGFGNLMRTRVLHTVHGWNLAYNPYGWDDTELCLRMRKFGARIVYIPEAIIYHSGTRVARAPISAYERSKARNYFLLINDYATFAQKVAIFAQLPFRAVGLITRHIINGQWYVLWAHMNGFFGRTLKQTVIPADSKQKIKLCIISSQLLNIKKIGGFGSMTKQLALLIPKDRYEVIVLTPRGKGANIGNGVTVKQISKCAMFLPSTYKNINAYIYHSQHQNIMTAMAMVFEPKKKHVITIRDPRSISDFAIEFRYAAWNRRLKGLSYFFEEGPVAGFAVRRADVVGYAAYFLNDKIKKLYRMKKDPLFLPNIENIPETIPRKSETPVVGFIGRWDRRKGPAGQ